MNFIQNRLTSRHLPWQLALFAMLALSPTLNLGWQADDQIHRAALLGVDGFPEVKRSPSELFAFVRADPEGSHRAIDRGLWPWWCPENLKLAFLRPVTGLTHSLDYTLWPDSPAVMHLHSLLWFGLVVAATAWLYRRIIGPTAVAGLAALLFTLDDAHAMPAVWIANRNALIALFFGVATLLAHDFWRRDGWRPGAALAPVFLLASVLANEGGVATGAYLLAYALFLDRDTVSRRFMALLPCATVGIAWTLVYKALGYGAAGSGVYIDPATTPPRFAQAVVERIPALLRGQWTFLPAELDLVFIQSAVPVVWWLTVAVLAVMLAFMGPLLKRDAVARFWGVGMALALLPACSTFPSNRLLVFIGLGGMGLLAGWLHALWTARSFTKPSFAKPLGLAARGVALTFLAMHLLIGPLTVYPTVRQLDLLGQLLDRSAASLPEKPGTWTLIVNTPSAFLSNMGPVLQALEGRPTADRTHVLGSSLYGMEVERSGARTLRIRPQAGFFPPLGTPRPGNENPPVVSFIYTFQMLDLLFRDPGDLFEEGQRIELTGLVIEITDLDDATGRVREASFHFAVDLEDPSLNWLSWRYGLYVPFALPALGETVVLEPAGIPAAPVS